MRTICLFLCLLATQFFLAQKKQDTTIQHIQNEQAKLVKFWADTITTPLARKERAEFTGIHHFPINLKYRVTATLEKFDQKDTVIFATSSARKKRYIKYAKAKFKIDGKEQALILYRMADNKRPEYVNLLFLPFTDLTSNNETYGGGRYIDLTITDANTLVIDFNLCYQPYCAYSHNGWSCPIPPQENFVNVKIKAGVKN
jgi:uncharacterized protein (DUF1684 family)